MPEYWVAGYEVFGGSPILRVLAKVNNMEVAEQVFKAVVDGGAFERVLLLEVKKEERL